MGILMVAASLTSCSSEDDGEKPDPTPSTGYTWTTDGGLKAASGILFTNGKEDAAGK